VEAELGKDGIEQATPLPVVRLIQVEDDGHVVANVDSLESGGGCRLRRWGFVAGEESEWSESGDERKG
jgi:hypothetical protein